MNRIRSLFPRTHWTTYGKAGDERRLVIWRQWLGYVWDVTDVKVA